MAYLRAWRADRVKWFLGFFALVWPVFFLLLDSVPSGSSGGYRAITTGSPGADLFAMTCVAGAFLGWLGVRVGRQVSRRRFLGPES